MPARSNASRLPQTANVCRPCRTTGWSGTRSLSRRMSGSRLVHAPSSQPQPTIHSPFGTVRRALDHAFDGVGLGLDADEVHALERRAEVREVHVRVDEPGQDGRAVEIDDARARALVAFGVGAAADERDPAAVDRDGLGVGPPAVERRAARRAPAGRHRPDPASRAYTRARRPAGCRRARRCHSQTPPGRRRRRTRVRFVAWAQRRLRAGWPVRAGLRFAEARFGVLPAARRLGNFALMISYAVWINRSRSRLPNADPRSGSCTHIARAMYGAGINPGCSTSSANVSGVHLNAI